MKKLANDCLIYAIGLLIAFIALEYAQYGHSEYGSYFMYFGWVVVFITAVVFYFRVYAPVKSNPKVSEKLKKTHSITSSIC